MTDLSRLSYRMSKQLDMALNDLKHVRENIDEINGVFIENQNMTLRKDGSSLRTKMKSFREKKKRGGNASSWLYPRTT